MDKDFETLIIDTEDGVCTKISDNGPGVPPKMSEKIFEPFFSNREDGTGLGLSISRKIAESYGGTVRLIEGETGACFELFLPDKLDE